MDRKGMNIEKEKNQEYLDAYIVFVSEKKIKIIYLF